MEVLHSIEIKVPSDLKALKQVLLQKNLSANISIKIEVQLKATAMEIKIWETNN